MCFLRKNIVTKIFSQLIVRHNSPNKSYVGQQISRTHVKTTTYVGQII